MLFYLGTYNKNRNVWIYTTKRVYNISEEECNKKGFVYLEGLCFKFSKNKVRLVSYTHRDENTNDLLIDYNAEIQAEKIRR